ncbi:hypothetical protein CEXT_510371 [Caerostris extrusa]|uniref:Uncharacterized protein n=1 Tax=Caerostris extrusa TaxID=172846 RepID=A0AAV4NWS0_CAEEX|nr:hypothetical protein CEXT_510371 [Caerostris extrusa]
MGPVPRKMSSALAPINYASSSPRGPRGKGCSRIINGAQPRGRILQADEHDAHAKTLIKEKKHYGVCKYSAAKATCVDDSNSRRFIFGSRKNIRILTMLSEGIQIWNGKMWMQCYGALPRASFL